MQEIQLRSLLEADAAQLALILSDPKVRQHMPLAAGDVDAAWVEDWRIAKTSQWLDAAGLGPWAVFIDRQLAGWGGVQPEDDPRDAGLAMVLAPDYWGYGIAATQLVIEKFRTALASTSLQIERLLVEFPETRHAEKVLSKFGFVPIDPVYIGGIVFNRYALPLID